MKLQDVVSPSCFASGPLIYTYFVIRSSIDLGSSMKVGRTTLLRSAPGLSWEMMCERTADDGVFFSMEAAKLVLHSSSGFD